MCDMSVMMFDPITGYFLGFDLGLGFVLELGLRLDVRFRLRLIFDYSGTLKMTAI